MLEIAVVPWTLLAEFPLSLRSGGVRRRLNALNRAADDVITGPTDESIEEYRCVRQCLPCRCIREVATLFRVPEVL